jgi:hypothetical protein
MAALSRCLPDPDRFAELLAEGADRVIVDTFLGDGSDGKRTARRPLPRRFDQLGLGDWRDVAAAERLHHTLLERIGRERVGWSREGFNDLAITAVARISAELFGGPVGVEPTTIGLKGTYPTTPLSR